MCKDYCKYSKVVQGCLTSLLPACHASFHICFSSNIRIDSRNTSSSRLTLLPNPLAIQLSSYSPNPLLSIVADLKCPCSASIRAITSQLRPTYLSLRLRVQYCRPLSLVLAIALLSSPFFWTPTKIFAPRLTTSLPTLDWRI